MKTKNSNQTKFSPRPTVCQTGGEVLEDGTLIELIEDPEQPGGLCLMKWDGFEIVTGKWVMHGDRAYVPVSLDSTIRSELLLPCGVSPYASIDTLSEDLLSLTARYTDLAEHTRQQLVAIVLASWVPELLAVPLNVWLWTISAADGARVLELLRCLCRISLPLSATNVADLRGLPSQMPATLLILRPASGRRMQEWLAASGWRHFLHTRSGRLIRAFGAKIIAADAPAGKFANGSFMEIPIVPSRRPLFPLDPKCQRDIARQFLSKLLQFRIDCCGKKSPEPGDGKSEPPDAIVGGLSSNFVDAPKLRKHLALLEGESDANETRVTDPRVLLLKALLARCHELGRTEIYVAEIAKDLNAALHGEGATSTLGDRLTGSLVKDVGLVTKSLGQKGRGLRLDIETRQKIHRLARSYNVLSADRPFPGCSQCADLQIIEK